MVSSRDFGLGFERPTLATETIGEQARARRSGGWGDGAQGEAAEGRRLCQPRPGPAHGAGSSGCSLPLSSSTQGKGVLGTVEANPSFPAICGGGNAPGAGAGAGAGGGERGRRSRRHGSDTTERRAVGHGESHCGAAGHSSSACSGHPAGQAASRRVGASALWLSSVSMAVPNLRRGWGGPAGPCAPHRPARGCSTARNLSSLHGV